MNLDRRYDRVGQDAKLRSDFRNFLLIYVPTEGTALYDLQETHLGEDMRSSNIPATKVAQELKPLVDTGYSIDYVYQFSTADIKKFMRYAQNEAKIDKAKQHLMKACKEAFDAGVKHEEMQHFVVDIYEEIWKTKDFVYRFSMEKDY